MKKFIQFLFIITVLFGTVTCEKPKDTTGNITGTVRDNNGNTLGGVLVALQTGAQKTTGADGKYSFENLTPAQSYTLTFTKEGYVQDKKENIAVAVGQTTTVDMILKPYTPTITVTSPAGGATVTTATTLAIAWTYNITDNVKIELYKGTTLLRTIDNATACDGSYEWIVDKTLLDGTDYTIRLTSVANTNVYDDSPAFTIVQAPYINLTAPTELSNWTSETQQTITWTTNINHSIKIELWRGTQLAETLVADAQNNGTFTWNIPLLLTTATNYKIRVTSLTNNNIVGESALFTITQKPYIAITAPLATNQWIVGSSQNITWTDNITENVKIELLKAGNVQQTIEVTTASDGTHTWLVPTNLTKASDYQIRITSTADASINAASQMFSIEEAPYITLNTPQAADIWEITTIKTITWASNMNEKVKIELYKAGVKQSTIADNETNDGNYTWTIPANQTVGTDYKVRIAAAVTTSVFGESGVFSIIEKPYITITSPKAADKWFLGANATITWTDNITENLKIEVLKAETVVSTQASVASNGSYTITVNAAWAEGNDYKIRLTSTNSQLVVVSDEFTVAAVQKPTLSTTAATGITTTTATAGGTISSDGGAAVTLRGVCWSNSTAPTTANNKTDNGTSIGTYTSNLTGLSASTTYYLRAYATNSAGTAYGNELQFTTLSPSMPEVATTTATSVGVNSASVGGNLTAFGVGYTAATQHGICYSATNPSPLITTDSKVELGTRNTTGTFSATLTGLQQEKRYYARAFATNSSGTAYGATIEFTTLAPGAIVITNPAAGAILNAGDNIDITWTDNIPEYVKIELYKATTLIATIAATTASDGTHTYTLPANLTGGSDYTIRITSTIDANTNGTSAPFSIASFIKISNPAANSEVGQGTTYTITWTTNLTGNVKIDLLDNGAIAMPVVASTANSGTYNWTVPAELSGTTFALRITSLTNNTVTATSGTFTIAVPQFAEFVLVEGGMFVMGCGTGAGTCNSDETPTHNVTLSNFYMGKYEVTQAQWKEIMGTSPSYFTNCDNCPVEQVSWDDIQTFLTKLNQKYPGKNYRLPTEAQWEYAARGGKNYTDYYLYSGSNTIDGVAWYYDNSYALGSSHANYGTNPVGTKTANQLGIYDMSGNVWEWCQDWYGTYSSAAQTNPTGATSGTYRVLRGGSWYYDATYARCAIRDDYTPASRFYVIGFRLVRDM